MESLDPQDQTHLTPSDAGYIITEEDYERLYKKYDEVNKKADKTRAGLSTEQIHKYRARCKRDLFFLNSAIIGNKDLQPQFHGEWCEWIRKTFYHKQFALGLLPRAHFKTSTKTVTHNIQCALPYDEMDRQHDEYLLYETEDIYKPLAYPMDLGREIRTLIVHEVEDEAARFLFQITLHFMTNPMLIALFPECIPERRVQIINRTTLTLPRDGIYGEPTFDAKGVSAKQQGNHYNLISPDDIYGKEARKSDRESEQRKEFIDGIFGFMNNLSKDHIFAVGTRYKFDDVYGHMIDKFGSTMDVYRRKVEELDPETGREEIVFHERISRDALEVIKKNKEVYYSEWLNDPEQIGEGFNPEWWRTFEWLDSHRITVFDGHPEHATIVNIRDMYTMIHIDPGEKTGGFVITGTDYWWRTFTLAAIPIQFSSPQLMELLFNQVVKWQPQLVTIEYDAAQHLLGDWAKSEMNNRKIYFEIHPYKTNKREKNNRIEELGILYAANQLFHNDTQTELNTEFKIFGKSKDIHILDALAQIQDEGVRRQGFAPGSFGVIGSVDAQHPYSDEIDPETGYSKIEYGGGY